MSNQGAACRALLAEERYRLLVNAIHDYAVYMLDTSGIVVSWNPGAEHFKGYTAEQILGAHFSVFYTDPDRQSALPEYGLSTASTKGRFETEGWRVRKNGTRFWAHVVIEPIRTSDGELLGFAKVTRDLTQKKAAEDALRESEAQLRLLIEGVTDYAIYLLSSDGLVTNWNTGAQRIKGYLPEEVIGQSFGMFYTPKDQASGRPEANLALATRNGRLEEEGWRQRKDGTLFMAHVVIDAIRDQSGQLTGFAKVTRDVTQRYETQKALDRAREELFQAQKMEAMGHLTGGVAHDFNNLLTVILGSLKLVRKRLSDPRTLQLVDNAIMGAERGASLTQRMLAFSRKQPLQLNAIDLPGLVFGMRALFEQSIGSDVTIHTRFEPNLPSIYADGHQLEVALLNLVLNARDAMPNGGAIDIAAWVSPQAEDERTSKVQGRCVVIEVKDDGEGMDDETLAKAFYPFFTTKGPDEGTGLGLSMVHGFVEQIGGEIKLKSTKGEGTAVQLSLPIATRDDLDLNWQKERPIALSGLALRILILDNDDLVLQSTGVRLAELGHQALHARSWRDAVQILKNSTVDLAIINRIPGMSEEEVVTLLAQSHPTLPVINSSGHDDDNKHEGHAMVHLVRPLDEATLALVISEAVANAASQAVPAISRQIN